VGVLFDQVQDGSSVMESFCRHRGRAHTATWPKPARPMCWQTPANGLLLAQMKLNRAPAKRRWPQPSRAAALRLPQLRYRRCVPRDSRPWPPPYVAYLAVAAHWDYSPCPDRCPALTARSLLRAASDFNYLNKAALDCRRRCSTVATVKLLLVHGRLACWRCSACCVGFVCYWAWSLSPHNHSLPLYC
jgi:hypothetical protein